MTGRALFVLGGTGFVGAAAVREAVARGWEVRALARSDRAADRLRAVGARPVRGDAAAPAAWAAALRGVDVVLDLVQPALPARIGRREIAEVGAERLAATEALLAVLRALPGRERPLLLSVSGTDDLAPDPRGRIGPASPVRARPRGFAHVGIPVRRAIEASGVAAAHVVLGTVYGPGKAFASTLFPRLARGRLVLPRGAGRVPLVHVDDAARALVHLAELGRERVGGRTWVVVDAAGGTSLDAFFGAAAEWMGVPRPRRVPAALAALAAGRVLVETMTRAVEADASALVATGFAFRHPTVAEGLPATLAALGYPRHEGVPAARARPAVPLLLATSVAAILAVNLLDLPLTVPRLRTLAGGRPLLDLTPGYRAADAAALLGALGPAGRAAYLELLWTVDLALPLLFAATLWTATARGALRRWRGLGLAAGLADLAENVALTLLLARFPAGGDTLVRAASALTTAKFALYASSAAVALAGGRLARSRRLRRVAPSCPEVP